MIAISHGNQTYSLDFDGFSASVWKVGSKWWGGLNHSEFPMHLYAKTLGIELGDIHIYNGLALEALLRKPYVDLTFPKVRSLNFKFNLTNKTESLADDATIAPDIEANIRAFVRHIKRIAPMVQDVLMTSAHNIAMDTHPSRQYLDSLVTQLCESIRDISFFFFSRPICVEPPVGAIRRLSYLNNTQFSIESIVQLARHSASTLQSLDLYLPRNDAVTGLIRNTDSGYVQYPCLHTLKLETMVAVDMPSRPVFPGAIPFPCLQNLSLILASPIGDDTTFRGNAATLKSLELYLTLNTVKMLDENMVFTPTSHSSLQSVRLKWSPVREGSRSAADLAYMQFGLSIGPNAPVREFGVPLNPIGFGPAMTTLSGHKCIQVLELAYTCVNVLDVIALVKALPLVSHIHSMTLSTDPFPDNLPEHKLPAYVIANYTNIGKRFRCWRIDTNPGFAFKTVAKWALLLALACPNLGYVAVPASSRELFMAYMKEMIASDGYRQHATRLQRLLFGGWQNSIPSVEAIQAKSTTATVSG